jgi:4-hydroxy-tetrahydrodipicolinate reductase
MCTKKPNIGLIGFGNMGTEIANAAGAKGFDVMATYDIDNPCTPANIHVDIDVLIDFSIPDAVLDNIRTAAAVNKPLVIGTTGWYGALAEVDKIVRKSEIGVIYAANFSLGMNLFFQTVSHTAGLMNAFAEYDVYIHEVHHRGKIDSPSGTALSLGNIVKAALTRKQLLKTDRSDGQIDPTHLHVTSTRVGQVPGSHVVGFESMADGIEIKHTARNRSGFIGRQGLFTMDDLMKDLL